MALKEDFPIGAKLVGVLAPLCQECQDFKWPSDGYDRLDLLFDNGDLVSITPMPEYDEMDVSITHVGDAADTRDVTGTMPRWAEKVLHEKLISIWFASDDSDIFDLLVLGFRVCEPSVCILVCSTNLEKSHLKVFLGELM